MSAVGDLSPKISPSQDAFPRPRRLISGLVRDALGAQLVAAPLALVALGIAAALIGAGAYILAVTGQPLTVLVRDANAIADQPNYFAALEHAEILLMDGAGWIALFAALFCQKQVRRYLFLGGLLTLLLASDDLYMFHESAWRFGIREHTVFAFYAVLLILLVVANLRHFLRTPFFLLGTALLLFAVAMLIDDQLYTPAGLPDGSEDCFEVTAFCFWSVYFVKCAWDGVRERLAITA